MLGEFLWFRSLAFLALSVSQFFREALSGSRSWFRILKSQRLRLDRRTNASLAISQRLEFTIRHPSIWINASNLTPVNLNPFPSVYPKKYKEHLPAKINQRP